ncbi:hypothetical protein [Arcanobacterium buesumense]|uniref:DUF4439 domain-containing protein n=1 Tax=Arcanobacterium buesumense TaxID=2722751 RepID=A0A6H2EK38_9ACTO|nr:hypothetical protein [Arcanobacterium buesumense]QJC21570.1 hypothetical protein HC352_02960 [Arcanobacterium buesumense]
MAKRSSHSRSALASWLSFIGIAIVGIAVFALSMVLMGARLEHVSVAPEPPSQAEKERQNSAVAISRTQNLAQQLLADPKLVDNSETVTEISQASAQWLTAVGNVWIPWPDGAPEGYQNPTLDLTATNISVEELHTELLALADMLVASTDLDGSLATSIATKSRLLAQHLIPSDTPATACHNPDFSVLGTHITGEKTLASLEVSRQWLEYHAAITDVADRADLHQQISLLTQLTENMLDAGTPDSRPALAPLVPDSDETAGPQIVVDELIEQAQHASADEREATTAFLCQFASTQQLSATPGLAPKN